MPCDNYLKVWRRLDTTPFDIHEIFPFNSRDPQSVDRAVNDALTLVRESNNILTRVAVWHQTRQLSLLAFRPIYSRECACGLPVDAMADECACGRPS